MKSHQQRNQVKVDRLEAISRERNLPVTIQRRVVLNALLDRDDHPTVDQLFEDVKERMPGVSRTTIYRALETLVELGLARRTNHFEASARFDGNTDHHHHLVCRSCNRVEDIDHPSLKKFTPPNLGKIAFEVLDYSILLEGLCGECQKSGSKSAPTKRNGKPARAIFR
ncbi:MAG: Fur family transcriptional regulator [Candidatus Binatia bacterium]